jgi:hypothetical protein
MGYTAPPGTSCNGCGAIHGLTPEVWNTWEYVQGRPYCPSCKGSARMENRRRINSESRHRGGWGDSSSPSHSFRKIGERKETPPVEEKPAGRTNNVRVWTEDHAYGDSFANWTPSGNVRYYDWHREETFNLGRADSENEARDIVDDHRASD